MKNSLRSIMLRGGVFVCIVTLLLTSCENFLKANQVKNEIEESIEIANSSPILYHIIADKDSGTVSPSQATLKKKQSVNLLFTPADGWSFICWEALDRTTGEPVPDAIQFENPQKLETKAKILKPTENLMIHPKCQLVPKVIEITPKFDNSGCDQDRTIEIIFNKSVDPQTFDFAGISITTPEGAELFSTDPTKSFFETPYFSNDNKVLNIPTIKGKFLLLPDDLDENTTVYNSKKSTDDITVRLNLPAVKDTDGLIFEQPDPHTYRVNKTVDNVPPVITSIDLFSTSDESDYFYKKLTDKPFFKEDGTTLNWSSATTTKNDGTTEFQNGDYSQNHVSQLYITLSGYDKDSGLKTVCVKEIWRKDTYGTDITGELHTAKKFYSIENDILIEIRQDGTPVYTLNHNFDNTIVKDGLCSIEVSLIDKANNESVVSEYWIIKDTYNGFENGNWSIRANISTTSPVYNSELNRYESPINSFFDFTVNADVYYSGLNSSRYISLEIYDEGAPQTKKEFCSYIGIETQVYSTINNLLKDFKRNVDKTTCFKVIVTEETGLSSSFVFPISKRLNVVGVDNNQLIRPENEYKPLGYSLLRKVYYSKDDSSSLNSHGGSYPEDLSDLEDSHTYKLYILTYPGQINGSPFYVYSAIGQPFTYYKNTQNSFYNENFPIPDFTLPQDLINDITYPINTGMAKFNVSIDSHQNSQYLYNVILGHYNSSDPKFSYIYSFSEGETIEVPNGWDYKVYLNVIDSNGHLIKQSDSKSLVLQSYDNLPPDNSSSSPLIHYSRSNCYIDSDRLTTTVIPYDKNKKRQSESITEFDYYFVPASYNVSEADLDFLARFSDKKRTTSQKNILNQKYYDMFFDYADGAYKLIYNFQDSKGNYQIYVNSGEIYHFIAEYFPSIEYSDGSFIISAESYSQEFCKSSNAPTDSDMTEHPSSAETYYHENKVSIKYLYNNDWLQTSEIDKSMNKEDDKWNYSTNYSSYQNKFIKIIGKFYSYYFVRSPAKIGVFNVFMKPIYLFPDYYKYLSDYEAAHPGETAPVYCTSKTWMPMANGWQIFNDKPCFVHTRYCSKNLTEPGDLSKDAAYEWEARAQETGIVYNDGSTMTFSYTDDNLAGVPSGYYYTTICHFADGTVVMSEVKQK